MGYQETGSPSCGDYNRRRIMEDYWIDLHIRVRAVDSNAAEEVCGDIMDFIRQVDFVLDVEREEPVLSEES